MSGILTKIVASLGQEKAGKIELEIRSDIKENTREVHERKNVIESRRKLVSKN